MGGIKACGRTDLFNRSCFDAGQVVEAARSCVGRATAAISRRVDDLEAQLGLPTPKDGKDGRDKDNRATMTIRERIAALDYRATRSSEHVARIETRLAAAERKLQELSK